jgi:hypothetical protein
MKIIKESYASYFSFVWYDISMPASTLPSIDDVIARQMGFKDEASRKMISDVLSYEPSPYVSKIDPISVEVGESLAGFQKMFNDGCNIALISFVKKRYGKGSQ